jgi:glycosyltransferase involved in cell wall biosynthesis
MKQETEENKPKILQVGKFYPPHRGGMEAHLEHLSQRLCKSTELRVLVANNTNRNSVEVLEGVKVNRLATPFTVASSPVCPSMARAIRAADPDILHLHFPNPTAILAYMISRYRGPVVVTWHSDIVRQNRLARLFKPILDTFLRRCSRIVASSPDYIRSSPFLQANRQRCRVIPFGIPLKPFQDPDPKPVDEIRAQFGPRIVLCVGRLVYYKGIEFMIRAMSKIDGKLLIIGDGPLRSSLEREARDLGVLNRVVFVGSVDSPTPYYKACDVFVLPSIARSEAFGIVQLEALAAGKPVVNTSLASGVPFVSQDSVTGFTVPPANPEALAWAVNTLLDNPDLRSRFGAEGVRRAEHEFSVDRMASSTLELYAEVIKEGPRSSKKWRADTRSAYASGSVPVPHLPK